MELLRICVYLTGNETVRGGAHTVVMLPFTGRCDSALFTGEILPGGVDTQRITEDGRCALSARYMLAGMDCEGKPCRLFIENTAVSMPGQPMVTHPVIRTDSMALRWLEQAELSGAIEHFSDHIEIVISGLTQAQREHVAIMRAGLTLRGVFEKRVQGCCPLVLMLHGFGGCRDERNGGLLQDISDRLTAAGLATLRFDFNGHGESDGSFTDMTPLNEVEDAAAFLQWTMKREDVSEVYLLGHSQGGVVAGLLAGYYREHVRKLVMLAPAASLIEDSQKGTLMGVQYDPMNVPEALMLPTGQRVGGLYLRVARTLPIHEITSQYAGPALAVIGGRDCVVSAEAIRRYGRTMPDCRVIEKQTLDHGLGGEEHDALMQEIIAFLKEK